MSIDDGGATGVLRAAILAGVGAIAGRALEAGAEADSGARVIA